MRAIFSIHESTRKRVYRNVHAIEDNDRFQCALKSHRQTVQMGVGDEKLDEA